VSNFILIIFCLFAGAIARRLHWVAKDGYKALNAWVLYFGLPALSFSYLPTLQWDSGLLFTLVCPLIVLLGSILFFYILGNILSLSTRSKHTLMLVGGFSNTSFVGFPLITAYYGVEYLPYGIVADQMTFFLLSTVGVIIGMKGSLNSRNSISIRYILKRVVTFPPFVGCVLALTIGRLIDLSALDPFFKMISSTVSPIALFSIGLQLNFGIVKKEIPNLAYAIGYKLLIAPLLVSILAVLLKGSGFIYTVSVFEMAMPTLVSTSIVIDQFKLNNKLGNSAIGLSIPLSLISSYLWYEILKILIL